MAIRAEEARVLRAVVPPVPVGMVDLQRHSPCRRRVFRPAASRAALTKALDQVVANVSRDAIERATSDLPTQTAVHNGPVASLLETGEAALCGLPAIGDRPHLRQSGVVWADCRPRACQWRGRGAAGTRGHARDLCRHARVCNWGRHTSVTRGVTRRLTLSAGRVTLSTGRVTLFAGRV
jgi:hypothetical protein